MENLAYVDKFIAVTRNTPDFQHKNTIYAHLHKKSVDNVEKFVHI